MAIFFKKMVLRKKKYGRLLGSLGPQGPCVHREPNPQLPLTRKPLLKTIISHYLSTSYIRKRHLQVKHADTSQNHMITMSVQRILEEVIHTLRRPKTRTHFPLTDTCFLSSTYSPSPV